ncbi:MAG: CD225/dispanin family protein [Pirellulaceae bacterium]
MFCRKCGTNNADGATTCISCGEPLAANPYQPASTSSVGSPAGSKPQNYLVQSILVTLCCCLPLGIVAIIYAAQVDSKWNAGDHQGAYEASRNANKWGMIAFGLGIVANLLVFGIQILVGLNGMQMQQ